jgi:N-acetyl-alpha-D-muramate 1-phosphate uridylyltransferase
MSHAPYPLLIFAAGFGTRMGKLTADRPKPLIPVAGKALIDHALEVASAAGIVRPVVNLHYRADQIVAHLRGRDVAFSHERDQILETGGGLKAALPLLGPGPVMTLNSDVIWTGQNPLTQLAMAWDSARMDALLLLLPVEKATGHGATSDFRLAPDGRLGRANGARGHVYVGASMINPDCLAGMRDRAFSLNLAWDRIIATGRAHGTVHQGGWYDIGTAAGIAVAEALLHG